MPARHRLLLLLAALLLGACGGETPKAPVQEQRVAARAPESTARTVRTGDTLYSIAWESGRDYRELAEWNGIAPPYVIRPGQMLRLYPPKDRPAPKPAARDKKPSSKPERSPAKPTPVGAWAWPADGALIERFGLTKGIGIAGRKGQPVFAAAPGTVVYQGSGLRGYGALIIVKHDADFLSAYAHNDKILVKEGDVIRRRQKIAEMGSSGTDRVQLHFEIRHRGAPVDPLAYLPKK